MVSNTPRPHFTPGKDPARILQEAGWVPGPVWTGGISRPHRDSILDLPARSQSLYRLSYRAHKQYVYIKRKVRDTKLLQIRYDNHNTSKPRFFSGREFYNYIFTETLPVKRNNDIPVCTVILANAPFTSKNYLCVVLSIVYLDTNKKK